MTALAGRIAAVAAAVLVTWPGHARADAAGPTDYQSVIVAIVPAAPQLHASIVGGDSFLLLRVDPGTEVEVLGYRSEPFIRFLGDGTVQENRSSASYVTSRSRSGSGLPDDFVDGAPPAWHTVATNGEYAWHDHRTHWMTDTRPPGKRPGDVVQREDVPLLVDGAPVVISIESVWRPAASSLPMWFGAAVGLAAGVMAAGRGRMRWRTLPALDVAVLAAIVGWWQYRSLPAETGPLPTWFGLPLIATLALVGATAIAMSGRSASLTRVGLMLLAGVNLTLWGWMRRAGLTHAILPTNAPGWLDRFASSAALAAGAGLTVAGLATLATTIASPAAELPATSSPTS